MNEVKVDVSGTVVSDPVLRHTRGGDPFLSFRLAVNSQRWTKDGGWIEGDSQYFSVTAFRVLAGNGYHSLSKGQAVLVSGRLRLSRYQAKDGTVRNSVQIDAHDLGPSLKFGQTTFTKELHPEIPSDDRLADAEVEATRRELEEVPSLAESGDQPSQEDPVRMPLAS